MTVRNAAKAVIQREGKILMLKCEDEKGLYYELPGGGQEPEETLEEAVIRECREETGYAVQVDRFLAMAEIIRRNKGFVEKYPEHIHCIYFLFACRTVGDSPERETNPDAEQVGMEWIAPRDLQGIRIAPPVLHGKLVSLLNAGFPVYIKPIFVETDEEEQEIYKNCFS